MMWIDRIGIEPINIEIKCKTQSLIYNLHQFSLRSHQIKENMFATERHHKDTLQQMEHKFFEEKVRLQQEASKKIAELAERAHSEAIR